MSPPNSSALPYRVLSRKVFANSRQIYNFLLQVFHKSYSKNVLYLQFSARCNAKYWNNTDFEPELQYIAALLFQIERTAHDESL